MNKCKSKQVLHTSLVKKILKKAKTTRKRKSVCLRQECVKALASLCDRHRQVLDCGQVLAHGAIAFCCLYTPHCSCISFSMCVCVFVLSGGGDRIEGSRWGWGLQRYENQKEDSWQEERFLVKLVLLLSSFLPSLSHSLSLGGSPPPTS